jgi:SAM-dependent methyltransferase
VPAWTGSLIADNPWLASGKKNRGQSYERRLQGKAAKGQYLHGEADLVQEYRPATVLDAGCGTGRVAAELARRGVEVVGVDLDDSMLAVARRQPSGVEWVQADLSELDLDRTFDVVLAAGNVMIFLTPGTEGVVVTRLAAHLSPGGVLIAGFALRGGPSGVEVTLAQYDGWCTAAGLALNQRYATWEGQAYGGEPYAVSVHRRFDNPPPQGL